MQIDVPMGVVFIHTTTGQKGVVWLLSLHHSVSLREFGDGTRAGAVAGTGEEAAYCLGPLASLTEAIPQVRFSLPA